LDRGNYTLTVQATSTDDSSQMAYVVIGPVLVFGSGMVDGQSAASTSHTVVIIFYLCAMYVVKALVLLVY